MHPGVADAATYWSAIVAVVPVFALALVLEARRTASSWDLAARWAKFFMGLGYLYDGVALTIVFGIALYRLADGEDGTLAPTVNNLLIAVLVILGVMPLLDFVTRGNPDIFLIVRRALPSSVWRKDRRRARHALRDFDRLIRKLRATIERGERALREGAAMRERTESTRDAAVRYADDVIKSASQLDPETRKSVETATHEFVDAIADLPAELDALSEARKAGRLELEEARQTLRQAETHRTELQEIFRAMKVGTFDDALEERLQEALAEAQKEWARP